MSDPGEGDTKLISGSRLTLPPAGTARRRGRRWPPDRVRRPASAAARKCGRCRGRRAGAARRSGIRHGRGRRCRPPAAGCRTAARNAAMLQAKARSHTVCARTMRSNAGSSGEAAAGPAAHRAAFCRGKQIAAIGVARRRRWRQAVALRDRHGIPAHAADLAHQLAAAVERHHRHMVRAAELEQRQIEGGIEAPQIGPVDRGEERVRAELARHPAVEHRLRARAETSRSRARCPAAAYAAPGRCGAASDARRRHRGSRRATPRPQPRRGPAPRPRPQGARCPAPATLPRGCGTRFGITAAAARRGCRPSTTAGSGRAECRGGDFEPTLRS